MFYNLRYRFFLAVILTCTLGYGQIDLDSLRKESEKFPNDSTSVSSLISQGTQLRKLNLDASLVYYNEALKRAKLLDNKFLLSRSLLNIGATYNLLGDFGTAAENLIAGLKVAEEIKSDELILRAYIGLGNMYSYSQQTSLGKGMYLKALKYAEAMNNKIERATILNNLGALTYRESNLDPAQLQKAVSYFLSALAILESTEDKSELIDKYNNLGLLYCDMEKPDSALFYLAKSKKIIDLDANPDDLIVYYNYLGRVYAGKKEFDKAEKAYLESINECVKLNERDWIYENYLSMAGLYEGKLDFEKAFEYYRRYSLLKDSVVNESNFAMASDIKNKFEREKKESELNQLKAEQAKNRIFNIALILVSVLVVISGIMMYSRFKIKAVSERQLKIQNDIISQKNKDITDSITYARKIQQSVLPNEKFISKEMNRLGK